MIAKDGQEAFDKVRHSMESDERFDLVFMDVQMPNLDGIQSTKKIREMGFSAPIVALTAFAEKSNEEECLNSGMDFFLPKPIRRPALKQVLKKYCPTIPEEGEGESAGTGLKDSSHRRGRHAKVDSGNPSKAATTNSTAAGPIRHAPPVNRGSPALNPQRDSPPMRPAGLRDLDSGYDSNDVSPLS